MIKKQFLKVTQDGHFFDKHKRVLLAISGGKDSMNLLQLLYHYRKDLGIELGLAHVNYKLRPSSDQEEAYLHNWAHQHGLAFYCRSFQGAFTEERGRDFRYQFFKDIMEKEEYSALVTAHHADDQAETIFMKLVRGSRLIHLAGMQPVQDFPPGQLIRPLLHFRKSNLEDCFHFDDQSNQSPAFFRNRVRNNYLPRLEKENPAISQALIELGQESHIFKQALIDLTKGIDVTNLATFLGQSRAVQHVLLQLYLQEFPDLHLSKSQFNELHHIIVEKANVHTYLKNGYWLKKNYKTMSIQKIGPETDSAPQDIVIKSDGIFHWGPYLVTKNQPLPEAWSLALPSEKPILLRTWQPGDRILLNGIQKKVSRYFIDNKIPLSERRRAAVIEQDGKILGISNIATSDLSKSAKNGIIKTTLYIKMKE
ncbi:tRNA lysidine(34) synthetase TilS [Streptococcus suis]|nr:tRNA lysidine(34) synthetase TilS [Streptococcus suis]